MSNVLFLERGLFKAIFLKKRVYIALDVEKGMVEYGLLLKKSLNDVKHNLNIFGVYFLLAIPFFLIMAVFVAQFFYFKDAIRENLMILIPLTLIEVGVTILLLPAVAGMWTNAIYALVKRNKVTSNDVWAGLELYAPLFKFALLKVSLLTLPLVLFGLIILLCFWISKWAGLVAAIPLGFIYILYLIGFMLFFAFGMFFFLPILAESRSKSVFELVRKTWSYTKANPMHVFLVWAISVAIGMVFSIVLQPFYILFSLSPFLLIPVIPLILIVNAVMGVFIKVFLFNAYVYRNLKK